MSNLLLFLDGAIYASLWTVGPTLLSSLLLEEHAPVTAAKLGRPISSDQALGLVTTIFRPLLSPDSTKADAVGKLWKSIPGHLSLVMLAFIVGRALGSFVGSKSSMIYGMSRWCPRRIASLSSYRVMSVLSSVLVSLLILNWGCGVSTFSGWLMVRFFTAFVNEALGTWGSKYFDSMVHHSKENSQSDLQMMEEGQPFISGKNNKTHLVSPSQNMIWLNNFWLAGVASTSLISGILFYPLNRIGPSYKFFVLLIFLGIVALIDRFLLRYYRRKTMLQKYSKPVSTFEDSGIIQMSSSSVTSPDRGLVNRKRHSNQQVHQMATPQRIRANSISSVESEIFFDCMDDIELGFEETEGTNPLKINQKQGGSLQQDNTNQIAIYSDRRVVYPDGTPAYIPVGEKVSVTPQGYRTLYRNKAQSHYQQTQQWRQKQQIHRIHARPHLWYPKIKVAYPHHIHGFTPNGMPVVYESPGKMNLKELFRNGCRVDDMIFHYCYLMEYMSNLESILTELHSELNRSCGEDWQEELAAYAYAKQRRLQSDNVSFGFVVVMDISGASPTVLSGDVMSYLSRAGEINSLHYPGSMRRAVAVQAPFWLGAAWGAIKGVMPASVTVDLLSTSKTMEGGLKEYIDVDQIPVEYGGKSKFRLGEHPFEVGLRKLVETQPSEDEDPVLEMNAGVPDEDRATPLDNFFDEPSESPKQMHFKDDNLHETINAPNSYTIEWDDLDADYVLIVATILFFLSHMVIGAIELALPLLLIIPPRQGLGFEVRRVAMTLLATCMTILWLLKKTRLSSRIVSITEKSPLSAFRIAFGSSGCFWLCLSLILSTLPPKTPKLGGLCLVLVLALLFFSSTLGIASVSHLRKISTSSFADADHTLPKWCSWIQHNNATPRLSFFASAFGIVVAAPVLRWYIVIPLNGSCFIVLACICGFLYIVSFALHSVTPPPTPPAPRRRRKVSQFVTAMKGLWWFLKDLVLVALGDTRFLWKELRGKVDNK